MSNQDSLLLVSVEVGLVKSCLLEWIGGGYRVAGWKDTVVVPPPTVGENPLEWVERGCMRLGSSVGRTLWNEGQPLLESNDPIRRPPLGPVAIVATPLPRLRVWLAGLSTGGLVKAQRAVESSPSLVTGIYRMEDGADSAALATELEAAQPQILVIVGGYDRPEPAAQEGVLALCQLLGRGLRRLAPGRRPALVYAGNRWAAQAGEPELRQAGGPIRLTSVANIQPASGTVHLSPLAQSLHSHYAELSYRSAAIRRMAGWAADAAPLEGVEWAFARLVRLWMEYQGLPHLHGLYCSQTWWLHVWADETWTYQPSGLAPQAIGARRGVRMLFTEPRSWPDTLLAWPPVQLVSGLWPEHWPTPSLRWYDGRGLAPMVAVLAQLDPQIAIHVLVKDIFVNE